MVKIYTKSELEAFKNADFSSYKINELTDVSGLKFDMTESVVSRAEKYFDTVENPYFFRVGDVGVRVNCIGSKTLGDSIVSIVQVH